MYRNSIKKHIPGIWVEKCNNNEAAYAYAQKEDETFIGDRTNFGPPPRNNKNKGGNTKDILKYIREKGLTEAVESSLIPLH